MSAEEVGICGRNTEIKQIHEFISSRVKAKKSGILYLTGPPGTGKSMSIQFVLDQIKGVPKLNINCMRSQTSRAILSNLCRSIGLDKFTRCNECEMISRLEKKFTGRTSSTYIIVLDEMDQLPRSKNIDLIKTIYSWPNQDHCKLILIGIANTVNLTSKYQAISSIIGRDDHHLTKILFKPYSSQELKEILNWYLENDENFEDATIEPKALAMIAAKFARENGDIRGALNALKSIIDDNLALDRSKMVEASQFPTPPSTPPLTPCKEKTNLASVANSIKKRQKTTNFKDDIFPFPHQVILTCIYKLCSGSPDATTNSKLCKGLVEAALRKYDISFSLTDYRAMLDNLELQGLVGIKKGRLNEKIIFKASDNEFNNLVQRKDMIMDLLNSI